MSEILRPDEDDVISTNTTYTIEGGESTGHESLADDSNDTYLHAFTENEASSGVGLTSFGFPAPSSAGPFATITLEILYTNTGSQRSGPLLNNRASGFNQLLLFSLPTGVLTTSSHSVNGLWQPSDLNDLYFRFNMTAMADEIVIYSAKLILGFDPTIGYDQPPPPVPDFILIPPRRRIVYPY